MPSTGTAQISRIAAAAGLLAIAITLAPANAASEGVKEFYIKTVHVDGKTTIHGDASHPPEAFPKQAMPNGGGLVLTKPNKDGKWRMRAFTFLPSQVTVLAGDRVRLNFVGVQGPKHTIRVEGDGVSEEFQLARGHMKTVEFTAGKPGIVKIVCFDHQPAMNGEVLILQK